MGRPKQNAERRFWNSVNKTDGCWLWFGWKDKDGYGAFKVDGKQVRVHRYVWQLTQGEISQGLCVLHKCDNPSCVNPDHLFLGSIAENNADRDFKGRTARGLQSGYHQHREKYEKGQQRWRENHPERRAKGEQVHTAKLTAEDVQQIQKLRQAGHKVTDLANRFGVTPSTISRIAKGQIWRHLYDK